jgi:hypothetical protein
MTPKSSIYTQNVGNKKQISNISNLKLKDDDNKKSLLSIYPPALANIFPARPPV